ncbi:MAG: D-TA family PLP-dependent enzyme [Bacteroidetes bacterium]|nr:D-TA family PLP-dependent enzyme [Bacteroidota bacterium]
MWFEISNVDSIDSPALVVYPDRVKENIRIMISFIKDVNRLRPHIKTNKSPDAVKLMMEQGIRRFKCATITEAQMLGEAGAKDVLLAYQPSGPKIQRLASVAKQFPNTSFSCLADNTSSIQEIGKIFEKEGITMGIWIDLNVGMNRTGILPQEADHLMNIFNKTSNIKFEGLHAYDGHIRDVDFEVRKAKCDEAFRPVQALADRIEKNTGKKPRIVAGGTPTYPIHALRDHVECSPGTFIYWDSGYAGILKEQPYQFAALLVCRVISKPGSNLLCIDLGHKSVASENPLANRVSFLEHPDLEAIGQSEEHLVVKTDQPDHYAVGQVLYGLPYHICPTVALYDSVWVVEKGTASSRWSTPARKK